MNVNCNNIYSNGQVSKTWRVAELYTCCPYYRKSIENKKINKNPKLEFFCGFFLGSKCRRTATSTFTKTTPTTTTSTKTTRACIKDEDKKENYK